MIAASLPITWSPTWITTSQITGLTLPGMIEEPFWSSGRRSSPSPARGPEPISARSLAILISETATTLSAPDSSTSASRLPCASNGSAARRSRARCPRRACARTRSANSGWVLRPGARRGAAERDLADARRASPRTRSRAEPDLGGVAAELLAEGHRHRVHQVRAAGLDDVGELLGLALQRAGQPVERRQQVVGHLAERRQVDRRREDVVRRLAHVHVVVGMGVVAGEVRDHLVGVHVRRGAGAGLEDVDRELVVVLAARRPRRRRRRSARRASASSRPSSALTRAAAALIRPSQCIDRDRDRLAGDGKFSTALRVSSPQSSVAVSVAIFLRSPFARTRRLSPRCQPSAESRRVSARVGEA